MNAFDLFLDLNAYTRKLTLKRHFLLNEKNGNIGDPKKILIPIETNKEREYIHKEVHPKSLFNPHQHRGPNIDTFFSLVSEEFRKWENNNNKHKIQKHGIGKNKIKKENNISKREKMALEDLRQNTDIVIRQADKGGGVVVQNRSDYIEEALNIQEAYERNILNNTEKRFLSNPAPTMALFYHLPKLHKNCEKPPGRPIISGIGSLTCHLSHYIDLFLQDLVKSLPSYLRDSTQLIEELRDIEWEDNYSFISLDVHLDLVGVEANLTSGPLCKFTAVAGGSTNCFTLTQAEERCLWESEQESPVGRLCYENFTNQGT
ncbi:uncharacterized protein LOC143799701 [Ranitomeya variabilis]|uniref:uncharacterized protein LOC143799701 n=1 Tax=Ranitomeya variabilis TaxID=490064 RepID=UPI0040568011